MIVDSLNDLPEKYLCRQCGSEKPVTEMMVTRQKKQKQVLLRPRCKDCNNKRERGHRREYKRRYLRIWRKHHSELNDSYWKQRTAAKRTELNAYARDRIQKNHHALLIQGRLRRRLGMHVTLTEATQLLKKFGPCYPTRYGLTPDGLRECERIRSANRRYEKRKRLHPVEIRMMVYEDGSYIKPTRQIIPYKIAAERLHRWQTQRRAA